MSSCLHTHTLHCTVSVYDVYETAAHRALHTFFLLAVVQVVPRKHASFSARQRRTNRNRRLHASDVRSLPLSYYNYTYTLPAGVTQRAHHSGLEARRWRRHFYFTRPDARGDRSLSFFRPRTAAA